MVLAGDLSGPGPWLVERTTAVSYIWARICFYWSAKIMGKAYPGLKVNVSISTSGLAVT